MHQPLCMYTNRFPPLVFPDRWFQSTWKKQQGVDVEWESGILLFQPGQTCPKYSTVHHLPASGELTRPCCRRSARWPKTVTFQLGQLTNFFFTSFCTLLLFVCTTLCCASPTLPYMLFHTGRDVINPRNLEKVLCALDTCVYHSIRILFITHSFCSIYYLYNNTRSALVHCCSLSFASFGLFSPR